MDGQQRLTTLCGALYWDGVGEKSIWNIGFDLDKEEFLHLRDENAVNIFPLNKLILTSDFIKQCMRFESHLKKEKYFSLAERLLRSIKDYKIAVVKLGDMTIEEVAPIFERINSTGRRLTMVDLMMAATWSDDFDLSIAIGGIKNLCSECGFSDIPDVVVLRAISAAAGFGINKDDIQKLRGLKPLQLRAASEAAQESLSKAIVFLVSRANVRDYGYIPYGLQLNLLAEYFRLSQGHSDAQLDELARWFWFTSVTRYFGRANTGLITRDIARIRNFAQGGLGDFLFDKSEIDISQMLFDRFNLRNASSTVFCLLLNLKSPQKTLDLKDIDQGYLKEKLGKFYGVLSPTDEFAEMNISRVVYPYFGEISETDGNSEKDLSSHLLDESCIRAYKKRDADGFIAARGTIIRQLVEALTGCEVNFSVRLESGVLLDEDFLDLSGSE
ncbi:MAG: DUF262 domain-containing protein [Cellvibrionaceae bacterium]|nr:DUF262 domain-containing protein [Cellvibrionaceae bacterium]